MNLILEKVSYRKQNLLGIKVDYKDHVLRDKIKSITGRRWHPIEKIWLIPDTHDSIEKLKGMGEKPIVKNEVIRELCNIDVAKFNIPKVTVLPKEEYRFTETYMNALLKMEEKLTLCRYSWRTGKSYRLSLQQVFKYFEKVIPDPKDISKEQYRQYVLREIKDKNISPSHQNTIINAIKFYAEKVLEQPREFYDVERPRKSDSLPNTLSREDVKKLFDVTGNLKHKCILVCIYSAGLRLGEVTNLRLRDISFDQNHIFIKAGKGKKDRYTLLANGFRTIVEAYLTEYKPKYWLFEGQDGGKYSDRSVQAIFQAAVAKAGIDAYATVHTLRHSFATHMIEKGVDIRYIQLLLGHNSIKTTEIYTHITDQKLAKLVSPLDDMDL